MRTKKKSVFFSITGEFVTNTARDWLYAERRPYEKVLDFLLSCMEGTDESRETLVSLADDVLMGKRKFTGNTRDGSFCMVNDDADVIKAYPLAFENKPVPAKERTRGEYEADIADCSRALERRVEKAAKKIQPDRTSTESDTGWLRPDGKFFEVGFMGHERWAIEYAEKHYPYNAVVYGGDFLIKKGWILLHSPSQGRVYV
jgi:hypothetical protein